MQPVEGIFNRDYYSIHGEFSFFSSGNFSGKGSFMKTRDGAFVVLLIMGILLIQSNLFAQSMPSISTEATSVTASASFVNVTCAIVTLDVTNVDKVLVVASFTGFSSPFGSQGTAFLRMVDQANPEVIISGVLDDNAFQLNDISATLQKFDFHIM
jgi:hypothetical protein